MHNVIPKQLAVVGFLCASACVFNAQPGGTFSDAELSVSLHSVRSGQPTTLQLAANSTTGPAADIAVAFVATSTDTGAVTFANATTDTNGIATTSYSRTVAAGVDVVGVELSAQLQLPAGPLDVSGVGVNVYPTSPAFAMTENDPKTYVAGNAAPFTLRVLDAADPNAASNPNLAATDQNFVGVVVFSSDANAVDFNLPAITFTLADHGEADVVNFTVTHAPTQTLTAYQQAFPQVSASHTFAVDAAIVNSMALQFSDGIDPNAIAANTTTSVRVVPIDAYGNVTAVTWSTIAAKVTSRDSTQQISPICSKPGVCTISFTETATGSYTLTVTGTNEVGKQIVATLPLTVVPADATHFILTPTNPNVRAGVAADFTVTAVDATNNIVAAYTGTVTFTSTDNQATFVPSSYLFTAADAGVHSFTQAVTFYSWTQTPTPQTLTVMDTGQLSAEGNATFNVAANQNYYTVALGNPNVTVDAPLSITVGAYDANGVPLNTSDLFSTQVSDTSAAVMGNQNLMHGNPADFASAAQFIHPSASVTLTISDATTSGSIRAVTTPPFTVSTGAAYTFVGVASATSVNPNQTVTVTYTVYDRYGNIVTNYGQALNITSNSDTAGGTPAAGASVMFSNGQVTVPVTFVTSGPQAIVARTGSLSSVTTTFTVNSLASKFAFNHNSTVTAGSNLVMTVTAQDSNGNTVPSYAGTVSFASSDTQATFPPSHVYSTADLGVYTFNVVFKTAGTQTFTASDAANGILSTTPQSVTAGPAASTSIALSGTSACSFVVASTSIVDAYNNPVSNANGLTVTPYLPGLNAAPQTKTAPGGKASFTFFDYAPGVASFVASPYTGSATTTVLQPIGSISALSSAAVSNGCYSLSYTISGLCNPHLTVTYSTDGTHYYNATLSPNALNGIYALNTTNPNTATPNALSYVWDTTRDLPTYTGNAYLRIAAPNLNGATYTVGLVNGYNFAAAPSSMASVGVGSAAIGDIDHKNFQDVAFGSNQNVYVSLNGLNSNAYFVNLSNDANVKVRAMAIGSFSGDGNTQTLVCTSYAASPAQDGLYGLSLLGGQYKPIAVNPNLVDCTAIQTVDFNLDGRLDIAVVASSGSVTVFINQGSTATALALATAVNTGQSNRASVIVRDFNQDGYPDILGLPASGNTLMVSYGNGGTVASTVSQVVALAGPISADVADFDHDSAIDLLVASGNSADIYAGIQQSGRAWPFKTSPSVGPAISYTPILAMDFNGDGYTDIFSGGSTAAAPPSITLGAPGMTFGPLKSAGVSFTAATALAQGQIRAAAAPHDVVVSTTAGLSLVTNTRGPRCNPEVAAPIINLAPSVVASAVADMSGDGKVDLLTLNANQLTLNFNAGDGTTASNVNYGISTSTATSLAVSDFDGDNVIDVAVTTTDSNMLFYHGQNGSLGTAVSVANANQPIQVLPVRLFNPNGALADWVTLSVNGLLFTRQNLSVAGNVAFGPLTSSGLGGATPLRMIATNTSPSFNNDNVPDIALISSNLKVMTFAGNQNGTFGLLSTSQEANYLYVTADDFTNDGLADVYAVTTSAGVKLLTTSSSTYALSAASDAGTIPSCIPESLNSVSIDGNKWLAVGCSGAQRTVLFQAGSTDYHNVPRPTDVQYDHVHLVDFTNDGFVDMVTTSGNSNFTTVSRYDDTLVHAYQGADQNTVAAGGAVAYTLVDYPGITGFTDGYLDAAVCDPNASVAQQYAGDGAGDFQTIASLVTNGVYSGVETADFDRNGVYDAALVNNTKLVVTLYGGGNSSTLTLSQQPNRCSAVDLNNDGWSDIVCIKYNASQFDWALNSKSASPLTGSAKTSSILAAGSIISYAVGDINGDGIKELVVGTATSNIAAYSLASNAVTIVGATTPGQYAQAQTLADFNNDGSLELMYVDASGGIHECTYGSGLFTCALVNSGSSIAIGDQLIAYDFTQDGILDLATVAANSGYVSLYAGTATGASFVRLAPRSFGMSTGQARVGDVDNDGRPDLSLSNNAGNSLGTTRTIFTGFSR